VTLSYDKSAAVVIFPALAATQITDPGLRGWLARGTATRRADRSQLLQSVLRCLRLEHSGEGLAALRMWGQTGDRPTVWIAAADPVYLEPRLDHLCLHALQGADMPVGDLGALFDYLQEKLAGRERYGFARIGEYGYVRANSPMPTSDCPSDLINGQLPNDYLPKGDATGSYHALRGEVEMALHDHEVNLRRESQGLPPVNSLWLWGGGYAPEQEAVPHPPLFSNDPLLTGYWHSKTGVVAGWPGSIKACIEASVAGFVAEPAAADAEWVQHCLGELRAALKSGRLSQLTVLFGSRYQVLLQRSDNWKIWRRNSSLPEQST
jgi:hypothetical protein